MTLRVLFLSFFLSSSAEAQSLQTDVRHQPSFGQEAKASPGSPIYERTRTLQLQSDQIAIVGNYHEKFGWLKAASFQIADGTKIKLVGSRACPGAIYQTVAGAFPLCFVDDQKDGTFDRFEFSGQGLQGGYKLKSRIAYKRVEATTEALDDGFKQSLIYLGSAGGVLRLNYREFKGDLARPAFTEELTYSSPTRFPDVIAFRDIRITVLGLDNAGIHYRVDENRQ